MAFTLPELPYAKDALGPHISAKTLEYHYGKHHQGYVTKLNALVEGTEHANQSLEEVIRSSSGPIFNNAAQVWNHTFYWNCLTPPAQDRQKTPSGDLAKAIDTAFGSWEAFKARFTEMAVNNFGSGWTWLVQNADGSVEIVNTSNAGTPLTTDQKPLLTCDVWEHAYYLDYQNLRPHYMDAFWELVNWGFAQQNYS
ncbi:MAG: superoxide dismutase [Fe] [Kistimonas sp.]|nr:superoxide dismutase [Fe] [Kistimonas sp.]